MGRATITYIYVRGIVKRRERERASVSVSLLREREIALMRASRVSARINRADPLGTLTLHLRSFALIVAALGSRRVPSFDGRLVSIGPVLARDFPNARRTPKSQLRLAERNQRANRRLFGTRYLSATLVLVVTNDECGRGMRRRRGGK